MTKDDIQAFSAVASLRSYTKAAALLFVTESSLSKKSPASKGRWVYSCWTGAATA